MSPDAYRTRFGSQQTAPEQRGMTITQSASAAEILAFYGLNPSSLPYVTSASAIKVPAVAACIGFLSRTMATLPIGVFRDTKNGPEPVPGRIQTIVKAAPNSQWSSFAARVYFWQQVFGGAGRGLMAIVRDERGQPYELWPMNAEWTRVTLDVFGRKTYTVSVAGPQPVAKTFDAEDVIDVPFMLAPNTVNALSPIYLGEKAIQLALAMADYASGFFAGGGVPPLVLEGPLPQGKDAYGRALNQVSDAIDRARESDKPIFLVPPGHKLTPVGFEPQKGQMVEARLYAMQDILRVWGLPPVFAGDMSGTGFQNAEMADQNLVKHLIGQWAKALEDEMNLKLFGQMNNRRWVRHDVDSLQRGAFQTRMEGLVRSVQGGIRTPNEARRAEGLPDDSNPAADSLFMQGATVPIGTPPASAGAATQDAPVAEPAGGGTNEA